MKTSKGQMTEQGHLQRSEVKEGWGGRVRVGNSPHVCVETKRLIRKHFWGCNRKSIQSIIVISVTTNKRLNMLSTHIVLTGIEI